MAQEVKTVQQQTPATRETGQRMPSRPVYLPPADIYETKDSIVVLAEMPGVAADGVDISLERRVLTIRGRSAANDHSGYQRVYNEYADGDYERVFTLSENIDRDRIEALRLAQPASHLLHRGRKVGHILHRIFVVDQQRSVGRLGAQSRARADAVHLAFDQALEIAGARGFEHLELDARGAGIRNEDRIHGDHAAGRAAMRRRASA